ncbi:MAG: TrmH family RNA methyltransferase [Candidatus Zhuqueibacterota bacterium]
MISKNRLKAIAALRQKKFRHLEHLFLVEGLRMCQEALSSDFSVTELLIRSDLLPLAEVQALIAPAREHAIHVTEIAIKDADTLAETMHSQGVFGVVQQKQVSFEMIPWHRAKLAIILDAGQDPGNVGTIIRTCDWFGADVVLLGQGTAELYNPKVVRATMGSLFHVPILQDVNLSEALPRLKEMGFTVYGADVNGKFLMTEVNYQLPAGLVIGNENSGIDPGILTHVDYSVAIPRKGKAESLNMAAAAAILISRIVN